MTNEKTIWTKEEVKKQLPYALTYGLKHDITSEEEKEVFKLLCVFMEKNNG